MLNNIVNTKHHYSTTSLGAKRWLSRVHLIMETTLYNPNFNNLKMAEALEISERNLFRKIKTLTGLPPQKYFRQFRLHKAMQFMIEGRFKTVKEISNAVGYLNVSYFILQFEKEFGKKPLKVLKEQGWR